MDEEAIPIWKSEGIIHEGAEATLTGGYWMGKSAVLKERRPRIYRHPDLDRRLTRQRLSSEARILSKLSLKGFPCPSIIHIDDRKSSILMSKIKGHTLYDLLKSRQSGIPELRKLGELIRRLHELGVSHGDLTTHNVMASPQGQLHLIDFGLSRQSPELEHLGLDIQVLNECLGASHSTIKNGIESVCEGYLDADSTSKESEPATKVIDRFRKITERVRYHG
tara:strand:+ start:1946 stop:2611 length:666 start_codon:yes stop_codon:yes gene_type:complete